MKAVQIVNPSEMKVVELEKPAVGVGDGIRTTRPCPVPRTARARATDAPRIARPVALTPWQSQRHRWQAKQTTFHLCHDDRVKKGAPRFLKFISFSISSLSLATGTEKGDISKRILLGEGNEL